MRRGGPSLLCRVLSPVWNLRGIYHIHRSVRLSFSCMFAFSSLHIDRSRLLAKAKAGKRWYPRQYGQGAKPPDDKPVTEVLDTIPECATSLAGSRKWFEFPITDPVFTGGLANSQGQDRVIAVSPIIGQGETRSFTYCMVITHRNVIKNGAFKPCIALPWLLTTTGRQVGSKRIGLAEYFWAQLPTSPSHRGDETL